MLEKAYLGAKLVIVCLLVVVMVSVVAVQMLVRRPRR